MKNIVSVTCLFCWLINTVVAQEVQSVRNPRPEIAIGAGYGLAMQAFVFRNDLDKKNTGFLQDYQGPALTLDYAHPVHKRLTAGPAISVQTIRVLHYLESPSWQFSRMRDLIRINAGVRLLFNFEVHENWKFYFGIRPGLTFWRELNGQPVLPEMNLNLSTWPSFQALGGMRYRIGNFGIGMEAALGTAPYLIQLHVSHRL